MRAGTSFLSRWIYYHHSEGEIFHPCQIFSTARRILTRIRRVRRNMTPTSDSRIPSLRGATMGLFPCAVIRALLIPRANHGDPIKEEIVDDVCVFRAPKIHLFFRRITYLSSYFEPLFFFSRGVLIICFYKNLKMLWYSSWHLLGRMSLAPKHFLLRMQRSSKPPPSFPPISSNPYHTQWLIQPPSPHRSEQARAATTPSTAATHSTTITPAFNVPHPRQWTSRTM